MLIDSVWLGETGKYLDLGYEAQTKYSEVHLSWPGAKYFLSGPPTQSIGAYNDILNLNLKKQ